MVEERRVKQLDARSVQALAHPLRVRIVGQLRIGGPATASKLAQVLGESSGATSYHLRALAKHGFVEEAPERGTKRERWWQAAQEMTSWRPDDLRSDPDARAAEEWLSGFHARRAMGWIDEWLTNRPSEDPKWVAVADQSDYWLRMTPDQVHTMLDEVHAVVRRHLDATEAGAKDGEGDGGDDDVRLLRLFLFAVPQRDESPSEATKGH